MSKVTVVGAGAVGATCANVMACREVASEVVLVDIKEGLSEGKMLDMYQTSTLMDFDTKLVGVTNDYRKTANSDVVVITSGIPRKPGMTREELIGTNANIMKGVVGNVIQYSPRAIIIVVANPMDTLTYLALKASGLPKNRIIGMGGRTGFVALQVLSGQGYRRQHQQYRRNGDRRSRRHDDDSAAVEGHGQRSSRHAVRLEEEASGGRTEHDGRRRPR